MTITISILALLVLLGILAYQRRSPPSSKERPPPTTRSARIAETGQFHAVSIRFTSRACEAAKALRDKRFLSSAAPRLPLDDCDVADCKCRFVHHKDRRSRDDRRNPWSSGEAGGDQEEKRHRPDRRADDSPEDFFK